MNFLKKLPISFKGELHHIQLINFSVEPREIEAHIPAGIKIRVINGRAMISMVNVELKRMHPTFLPPVINFNYRHVAFRLLVDDSELNNGHSKGIYFFRSFTNQPLVVAGGKMISDYNLEHAGFNSTGEFFTIRQHNSFLSYQINEAEAIAGNHELEKIIGGIYRAYSVLNGRLRMIRIQREKWPIELISCPHFTTNFFSTAKLEGAFVVKEPIFYHWLPPQFINGKM